MSSQQDKKAKIDHFHDVIVMFQEDKTKGNELNFAQIGPKWIAHSGQDNLLNEINALKGTAEAHGDNKKKINELAQGSASRVVSCKFDQTRPAAPRAEMLIFGTVQQAIRWAELMSDFIHTESGDRFRTTGNKVWPRSEEAVKAEAEQEATRKKDQERRRQWEIEQANMSLYWWYNQVAPEPYKGVKTQKIREVKPGQKSEGGGCCTIM